MANFTPIATALAALLSRVAVALISKVFQQDIDSVTPDDITLVVAPMKLWRARSRTRDETMKEAATAASLTPIQSLYFDGCKDETVVASSTSIREEHPRRRCSFGAGRRISPPLQPSVWLSDRPLPRAAGHRVAVWCRRASAGIRRHSGKYWH